MYGMKRALEIDDFNMNINSKKTFYRVTIEHALSVCYCAQQSKR
jgi:hypothetical protein